MQMKKLRFRELAKVTQIVAEPVFKCKQFDCSRLIALMSLIVHIFVATISAM